MDVLIYAFCVFSGIFAVIAGVALFVGGPRK